MEYEKCLDGVIDLLFHNHVDDHELDVVDDHKLISCLEVLLIRGAREKPKHAGLVTLVSNLTKHLVIL